MNCCKAATGRCIALKFTPPCPRWRITPETTNE